MNDSTLRSGSRQEVLLQPVLFNIVLEVLASAIKWQVEIKDMDYKTRNKIILFADDMIVYVKKSLKESTKKLLELVSSVRSQDTT